MSKAITLDLFAQLDAVTGSLVAIDDRMIRASASVKRDQVRIEMRKAEKIIIRSGRAMLKIANVAERIDAMKSCLKNCHRKQAQKAVLRSYPKFTPGMSTAEYVAKFASANFGAANVLPFDLSQYTEPCALYENGALDFDVIEEQIEESAAVQEVAEVMAQEAAPEIHKPQASPAFAALIRAARDAKRIARQAIAQAISSSLREVDDAYILRAGLGLLAQEKARNAERSAAEASRKAQESAAQDGEIARMVAEFPDLEECPGHGGVGAAKNIRRVLKRKFQGVKFKVTSDYSSVNVRWIDGPTDAAVCEALAPFDIGLSDSQSDYFYTERTRFSEKFGGVQYLFTRRELSDSAVTASIHAIFGTDGPTLAEWQRGTAWAQVECKGSYRDAQMRDQYGWLSMVRRHADEK